MDVFVIASGGTMQVLDVPPGCPDAAGPESWRTRVWGAEVVRLLGARFFPVLAESDLRVEADQVQDLVDECALLRENLERIVAGTVPVRTVEEHRQNIFERLAIVEDAAGRARAVDGGILIW